MKWMLALFAMPLCADTLHTGDMLAVSFDVASFYRSEAAAGYPQVYPIHMEWWIMGATAASPELSFDAALHAGNATVQAWTGLSAYRAVSNFGVNSAVIGDVDLDPSMGNALVLDAIATGSDYDVVKPLISMVARMPGGVQFAAGLPFTWEISAPLTPAANPLAAPVISEVPEPASVLLLLPVAALFLASRRRHHVERVLFGAAA